MSHASLIILSLSSAPEALAAAFDRTRDGERLAIVPPHLRPYLGSEPALNIDQPDEALYLQLIDNAVAALRPKAIVADLASIEKITPNLARHPQLQSATILSSATDKKKHLKRQAAFFRFSKIL